MGSYEFGYADKIGKAVKGFILIPKHAVDFFQTDRIEVKRYEDYGNFFVGKNRSVDAHVIQGIIVELAKGKQIPFSHEDIFFKDYDYSSVLEKYRLVGIDDYHDHITYHGDEAETTAKYPLKIVSSDGARLIYEGINTASVSGQYSMFRTLPPIVDCLN